MTSMTGGRDNGGVSSEDVVNLEPTPEEPQEPEEEPEAPPEEPEVPAEPEEPGEPTEPAVEPATRPTLW